MNRGVSVSAERCREYFRRHGYSRPSRTPQRDMDTCYGQFGEYSNILSIRALHCSISARGHAHRRWRFRYRRCWHSWRDSTVCQTLQILHVDVQGLANSYEHVAKVSSDLADILVDFDEADRTCCRTAGPGGTPAYIQCDGSCKATPDPNAANCYIDSCMAPLNQSDGWQAVKAVVNYVDEHMRSAGPQPVKPPGFPQKVRSRRFKALQAKPWPLSKHGEPSVSF